MKSGPGDVRQQALGLLSRREHSRQQLEEKLQSRGFGDDEIKAVVAELAEQDYLSDRRFAQSYVRVRIDKGHGPVRIEQELRQRGVAAELARACLAEAAPDWAEQAAVVRARRFGDVPPVSFAERARQARFLQYRGFTGEQINAALGGD